MARSRCAGVIAGSCAKLRVPAPMGASINPDTFSDHSGVATPALTISSAKPCWRQNTLTAAPPAMKLSTICAVTACG